MIIVIIAVYICGVSVISIEKSNCIVVARIINLRLVVCGACDVWHGNKKDGCFVIDLFFCDK